MSHRSEKLDKFIGKHVIIEFKRGKVEEGVLYHNFKGIQAYCLKKTDCDVIFCKTYVKKIKECN